MLPDAEGNRNGVLKHKVIGDIWASLSYEPFSPGTDIQEKKHNRLIHPAHDRHGCTQKEIARSLWVHYTAISKTINGSRH